MFHRAMLHRAGFHRFAAIAVAGLLLGACAENMNGITGGIAQQAEPKTGGTATVHVIMPCTPNDLFIPQSWKGSGFPILVDGQKRDAINSCDQKTLTVASGRRSIRLQNDIEFGSLFGEHKYAVHPGTTLYLRAKYDYGSVHLEEVSAERGKSSLDAVNRRSFL